MRRIPLFFLLGIFTTAEFTSLIASQVQAFIALGDLPGGAFQSKAYDISDDGTVVVGFGNIPSASRAFRWTLAGGMVDMGDLPGGSGYSEAFGVSGNGNVMAGASAGTGGSNQPTKWTGFGSIQSLTTQFGQGMAASFDGSVVVGGTGLAIAVKWQSGVMTNLGNIPGGVGSRHAYDVSADGSIIVGRAGGNNRGFRWTQATGMVALPGLEGTEAGAFGISADGSTIVGESQVNFAHQACKWNANGISTLGNLPGANSNTSSRALAASGNGDTIVGYSIFNGNTTTAFIWNDDHGMVSIRSRLEGLGLSSAIAGWDLQVAQSVSGDGKTIVGYGINPFGVEEGFVAVIPEPSVGFLLLATSLIAIQFRTRR